MVSTLRAKNILSVKTVDTMSMPINRRKSMVKYYSMTYAHKSIFKILVKPVT